MASKTLLAIFAVVGCVALFMFVAPQNSRALLGKLSDEKDQEAWQQFQQFMIKFNKTYSSMDELNARFSVFHDNYYWIQVQNQRNLNVRYGINHFADLTQEEFRNNYLGYKGVADRVKNYVDESNVELADSVDWVSKGAVTPIKDQGQCGSCWAFSAVGSLEGAYFQKHGQLVSFSEQELVDCSRAQGNQGCNGGLMDYAFTYWKTHSEEKESDYPYRAVGGICKQSETKGVTKIASFVDVATNELALKTAVNSRVISVAVDASNWSGYESGIYDGSCTSQLDHGVTLVGYGSANGQNYWRIKNSWSTSWGESGFIRLKRTESSSSGGQCGVATAASYPTL